MMIPCAYRNGAHGKFAIDERDPCLSTLGRKALQANLIAPEDRNNHSAYLDTKSKFADWCAARNIRIRNIYSGFIANIPTEFLEKDVLFAAEFQSLDDAMLFRLSWIN